MRGALLHFSFFCLLLAVGINEELSPSDAVAATKSQQAYSGNPNSMIYHNSGCRYFACKACVVRFTGPAEATKKGYRACKVCKG